MADASSKRASRMVDASTMTDPLTMAQALDMVQASMMPEVPAVVDSPIMDLDQAAVEPDVPAVVDSPIMDLDLAAVDPDVPAVADSPSVHLDQASVMHLDQGSVMHLDQASVEPDTPAMTDSFSMHLDQAPVKLAVSAMENSPSTPSVPFGPGSIAVADSPIMDQAPVELDVPAMTDSFSMRRASFGDSAGFRILDQASAKLAAFAMENSSSMNLDPVQHDRPPVASMDQAPITPEVPAAAGSSTMAQGEVPDSRRPSECIAVVLEFKHTILSALTSHVRQITEDKDMSTTDCLCGLIWIAVMRARTERFPQLTKARFTIPVDASSILGEPVPNSFGNPFVPAIFLQTFKRLMGKEELRKLYGLATPHEMMWRVKCHEVLGIRNDLDIVLIAKAAQNIRQAVQHTLKDPNYAEQWMAMCPEDWSRKYDRNANSANTGVDFSPFEDWVKRVFHTSNMEEDSPDLTGPARELREGECVLLPRSTSGPLGDNARWEVAICLRRSEMEYLRFPTELGGWINRVFRQDRVDMFRQDATALELARRREAGDGLGAAISRLDLADEEDPHPGAPPAKRQKLSKETWKPTTIGDLD